MNDNVKMGFQAVISSICAFAIGDFFNLDRPYWAVMTSMLVLCGFWGETLQKALHRITGTLLGFMVALIFGSFLAHYFNITLLVCAVCLFGIFFFRTTAYALVSFFITLMVLLFLSLQGDVHDQIGWIRLYETILGCIIGLIVSALFFSHKAMDEVFSTVRTFLQGARDEIHQTSDDYFKCKQHNYEHGNMKSKVSQGVIELNKLEKNTRYERVISGGHSRRILELLVSIQSLAILVSGLHEAVVLAQKQGLEKHFTPIFKLAQKRIDSDFSLLLESDTSYIPKYLSIEALRPQFREFLDPIITKTGEDRIKYFHVMPVFYYFNEIDKVLERIHNDFKAKL